MSPEIISAIIGVVGVFVTAIISIVVIKKEIYAKSVIDQRTKWLATFREKLGIFMAAWEAKRQSINNYYEPKFQKGFYNELITKGEEARYYLISALNTKTFEGNEYNKFIKKRLLEMNLIAKINEGSNLFEDEYTHDFIESVNRMLHQVWEEAKKEARR